MSFIMIDEDDDNIVDNSSEKDSDKEAIKAIIKQSLIDINKITDLLGELEELIEPFGDKPVISELKGLYENVVPNIMLGKYDEALIFVEDDFRDIALKKFQNKRKHTFKELSSKYNK